MRAQVGHAGAGDELALHQRGEVRAGGGPGADAVVPPEEGGDAGGAAARASRRSAARGRRRRRPRRPRGPVDVVGPVVAVAGEHRLDADRAQPLRGAAGDVEGDVVLVQPERRPPAVDAAVCGVEDDDLAGQARARTGHLGLLPQRPRVAAADRAGERVHRAQRGGPAGAVDLDAEAALELAQRVVGAWAEDGVDRAREQPEDDEPLLQRGDVVAAHQVPGGEQQDAVAQPPAGALEGAQGLRADDAVREQAAALLEGADGGLERRRRRLGRSRPAIRSASG